MEQPGTVRRDSYSLADFERLAGKLSPEYYRPLVRGFCGGCGAALPVGESGHCDAACAKRERDRNQKLFGRQSVQGGDEV